MSEIPIWLIVVAFLVGIIVGCILKGPKTWRPGNKEILQLRHDNEMMRLKLAKVGELVDRHKKW